MFPPSQAGARVSRAKFSRELQLRKLLLNRRRRVLLSLKLADSGDEFGTTGLTVARGEAGPSSGYSLCTEIGDLRGSGHDDAKAITRLTGGMRLGGIDHTLHPGSREQQGERGRGRRQLILSGRARRGRAQYVLERALANRLQPLSPSFSSTGDTRLSMACGAERTGEVLMKEAEVFVPAFAAWPAAQSRPAPPAMLPVASRPTLN